MNRLVHIQKFAWHQTHEHRVPWVSACLAWQRHNFTLEIKGWYRVLWALLPHAPHDRPRRLFLPYDE
ncbi:unnamed protein product [Sphenostylis stenocarpa]|uniref:Uncharacterized protein n=1 Tax=Sphenostylis stenocarpa TaxID=92480 RepID=A0AA86V9J9_9FABA|nr:unnamed protein product [Sphenostylis stenocarpa]